MDGDLQVKRILDASYQLQAITAVLFAIALLVTGLRLYAKWKLVGTGFSLDDSESPVICTIKVPADRDPKQF